MYPTHGVKRHNNALQLPKDATLTGADTTTPVDLDQLFNTFNGPARKSLRLLIQGFAQTYVGKGPQANKTYKVRIVCTTDAFVKVGDAPTATTSDPLFPANAVEYVTITPGQKVSAIRSAADGSVHVTEVV